MNRFAREFNAVVAISARDVLHFVRTPAEIALMFIAPIILMGILGGSLAENLGRDAGFNLLQFILFGIIVMNLYQNTMTYLTSLVEDREKNVTPAILVAPILRFSIIIGRIIGGTITSLVSLVGIFTVALLLQIPLSWSDVGNILLISPVICIAGGALGILFISLVNDPKTVAVGVPLLVLPQLFLAGVLNPISHLSGILGVLSHLMPLTYLADLMRGIAYAGRPEYGQIVLYNPAFDLLVSIAVTVVFIIAGTLLYACSRRNR